MAIVNPFDLLDLGEEGYDNDEVLFQEAEKKALEDAKANATAKEVAKFAALRAAAEKEDRDRTDAKEREDRERRKAKWKKAQEEKDKKAKERSLSQSQSPSEKESETSSLNGGEVKVTKKEKVRKPAIKVFPGDCEKPRLPILPPRKKLVEHVIENVRPFSRQSCDENAAEQTSELTNNGETAYENGNGNAKYSNYEKPRPSRKYRNAARRNEELVIETETEESLENNVVVSGDNKTEVNGEKNETLVAEADKADAEKEKKEEEVPTMTYPEYLRIREEQRKKLPAKAAEERKVEIDSDLQKMKPLPLNKGDEEIFVKLGSKKDGGNRKKASKSLEEDAKENGKYAKEKSISSAAFFRYPKFQRQQRQYTEDKGEVTQSNGNQGKTRWGDRQESQISSPQARDNSQQYRNQGNGLANQGKGHANPPAARGNQSHGYRAPYPRNQGNGIDGKPPSNGAAGAPSLKTETDFPPLK